MGESRRLRGGRRGALRGARVWLCERPHGGIYTLLLEEAVQARGGGQDPEGGRRVLTEGTSPHMPFVSR